MFMNDGVSFYGVDYVVAVYQMGMARGHSLTTHIALPSLCLACCANAPTFLVIESRER